MHRHNGIIHDEPNLLRLIPRRALKHLRRKVRREGHNLGRNETVCALVTVEVQGGSGEDVGEVECDERVEEDDLVGCVCVDGVVEGEVGWVVVKGFVQGGQRLGVGGGEAGDPFLEETLALGGGDRRADTLVVVKGLQGAVVSESLGLTGGKRGVLTRS